MSFDISHAIEILERTPSVLESMLKNLSDDWITKNEGRETWTSYDVVGHLIHGEKTDWIPRLEVILSDKPIRKFTPFDRFAQFNESKGKTLQQLLDEFALLRRENIQKLKSKRIAEKDYTRTAIHPSLGEVTLAQLLSTWVVHDLDHLYQISRVFAKQYTSEVGPWIEYLKILK